MDFKEIFDKSPIGVLFYNKEGVAVNANNSALKMLGFPQLDNVLGHNLFDNPLINEKKDELIDNGIIKFHAPLNLEKIINYGLQSQKKGILFLDYTISVTDSGFLVQIQDITKQKNADDELKESEARFHSLYENSLDAILLTKPDGSILAANLAAEEMFGMTEKEITKGGREGIVVKDERWDPVLKERKQKRKVKAEFTFKRKDGSTFPGEATSSLFTDADGFVKTSMIIRDLTERKNAENQLKELYNTAVSDEKRLNTLINTIPSAIVIIEQPEGEISFINQRAKELYGMDPTGLKIEEHPKVGLLRLNGTPYLPEEMPASRSLLTGEEVYNEDLILENPNGKRIVVSASSAPIYNAEGEISAVIGVFDDITERKKAENALRENEERYKGTLDNMLEGCAILGYDWNYIYVNDINAQHAHLNREEMIGHNMLELLPGVEESPFFSAYKRCMNERIPQKVEAKYEFPDGSIAWYEASAEPVPEGIFILSADITERKQAEDEKQALLDTIQAERDKLSALVNSIPDEVWFADTNKKFTLANPSALKEFGLYSDEIEVEDLAKSLEVYRPDGSPRPVDEAPPLRALKGEIVRNLEEIIRTPATNELRHRQVSSSPVRNAEGKIMGSVSVTRDITERKKAEEEIRRNLKLLNGINKVFEESLSCETVEEVIGKCLEVAEDLTGSEFSFIGEINEEGRLDDRAISPPGWEACTANPEESLKLLRNMEIVSYWGRTIKEEKSQIVNDPDLDPDSRGVPEGHPPITSFLGVPLKQGSKTIGIIALANKNGDYTEEDKENIETLSVAFVEAWMRKKAEENRQEMLEKERQLSEELQQQIKYEKELINKLKISNKELEQFAYVASHDLQEPLRMVASFSQLLERRYKDQIDEDADDYIGFIVEGANRMKDLIDDLLVFSRLNTAAKEFELTDLNNVLGDVLINLNQVIEDNNAQITHDLLPIIKVDPSEIRQLFQNLISNAIKFHGDEPPKIHISAEEASNEWKFSVKDEGIGIDKENHEKIFNVFNRLHTREEYEGTGIGLAICKRIVNRHGGRIWAESEEGIGSTFYFTIPHQDGIDN